jgi:hypothetical protein
MTMQTISTTRRALLAGAAASLVPVVAGMPASAAQPIVVKPGGPAAMTTISRLWGEAQSLEREMSAFAAEMAEGRRRNGLPGWMSARGCVNDLGNRRYDALVSMLRATPETIDDLAILGEVVRQEEMRDGPASWAHHQFDRASREYHGISA